MRKRCGDDPSASCTWRWLRQKGQNTTYGNQEAPSTSPSLKRSSSSSSSSSWNPWTETSSSPKSTAASPMPSTVAPWLLHHQTTTTKTTALSHLLLPPDSNSSFSFSSSSSFSSPWVSVVSGAIAGTILIFVPILLLALIFWWKTRAMASNATSNNSSRRTGNEASSGSHWFFGRWRPAEGTFNGEVSSRGCSSSMSTLPAASIIMPPSYEEACGRGRGGGGGGGGGGFAEREASRSVGELMVADVGEGGGGVVCTGSARGDAFEGGSVGGGIFTLTVPENRIAATPAGFPDGSVDKPPPYESIFT